MRTARHLSCAPRAARWGFYLGGSIGALEADDPPSGWMNQAFAGRLFLARGRSRAPLGRRPVEVLSRFGGSNWNLCVKGGCSPRLYAASRRVCSSHPHTSKRREPC